MTTLAESQVQFKQRPKVVRFLSDQRKWMPYLFVAPFFIAFGVFQFYPLLRSIIMGFQESVGYTGTWEWVGFANYVEALTDDRHVITALRNFIFFGVGSLVTQVPVAIALALMLSSPLLHQRGVFRTMFFIPAVLPGVLMGLVGVWFFSESRGLANAIVKALGGDDILWMSLPQYIMPMFLTIAFWQWTGNHAVFFLAGMGGIDRGVIEAAIIDGATAWQRTRYIVLPLLKPVLAFVTIIIALGSLMTYDIPAVVFTGTGGATLAGPGAQGWFFLPYIADVAFNRFRMGYATSIGWLVFIIAVTITIFQLRLYKFGEAD
jgi:ABC-type sugar transport system permease subunit